MSKVLVASINQIATEKDLDREIIYEAIEAALVSAYRRNYGPMANVTAKVDRVTGEMKVFAEREVVEDIFNERTEVTLKDAQKFAPTAQLGDVIPVETRADDFGRIAAQTAKQVILQRIREAERDTVYENFSHKVNEVLTAQVRSIDSQSGALTLVLDDKHEVLLMREEQIQSEKLRRGDFVKVYVVDVHKSTRGPVIKLSRTHRNLLRRLMEMEIPEVRDGIVEIKAIAREPGQRSKAGVIATRPNVDPVGSCVGPRGLRIQNIVNELAGEKIDVIEWSNDPATYITNALSPAKISYVLPDDKSSIKTAVVVVPDKQLSLAIGKEGQNARLAAKLTGWRIDIKSESEAESEGLSAQAAERAQRAKSSDLMFYVEQLLKTEDQPVQKEDRLAQIAKSMQELPSGLSEIGDSFDLEDEESKKAKKTTKAKPKSTGKDASDLDEGDELPNLGSSDLDSAFQRGLEAAFSFDEKPIGDTASSGTTFDSSFLEAWDAVSKEDLPIPIEPQPEEMPTPTPSIPGRPKPEIKKAEEKKPDELPEIITAAMLRQRMSQRKQQNRKDVPLEIPEELLAGYDLTQELTKETPIDKGPAPDKKKAEPKNTKKKKWRPAFDEDDEEF